MWFSFVKLSYGKRNANLRHHQAIFFKQKIYMACLSNFVENTNYYRKLLITKKCF